MIGWAFWRLLPLAFTAEINYSQEGWKSWKQEALELGCIFYSSTQMELCKKN